MNISKSNCNLITHFFPTDYNYFYFAIKWCNNATCSSLLPSAPLYQLLSPLRPSRARHAHLSGFRGHRPRPGGGVVRRRRDAALRPEHGAERHGAGDADQGRYVLAGNPTSWKVFPWKSPAGRFELSLPPPPHLPLRRQRADQPRGQPPVWARLHHCAREPHHPLHGQQDGYVFRGVGHSYRCKVKFSGCWRDP